MISNKFQILFYYFFFKRNRFFSRKKLENRQLKKFVSLNKNILLHSKFYNPLSKNFLLQNSKNIIHALSFFPILNKSEFLENFDTINTKGIKLERALQLATEAEDSRQFQAHIDDVDIGLSTGTSGKRGLFLVNQRERNWWVGLILARVLRGSIFKPKRIALILRSNSKLYETMGSRRILFRYFDMIEPLEKIIADLHVFQPTVLVGPPSFLELLAKSEQKLPREERLAPAQIIAGAETLHEDSARIIKECWDKAPEQIYQATEGFLAYTCTHGSLHLNEDVLIVEKEPFVEDQTGSQRFVPIITDLRRDTQPIVRHRLTDVLVEDKNLCPCGSVFCRISIIEGRIDDVLCIQNIAVFPDFICRSILKSDNAIQDFRLVQENPDNITLSVQVLNEELKLEAFINAKRALETLFKKLNIKSPEIIEIQFDTGIKGQKRRRVKRCFELNLY